MNLLAAVDGGIWGTVVLTAIVFAGRQLKLTRVDYGCLLGEIFLPPGRRAHLLGLAMHFFNGIMFGLVYMALLTWLGLPPVTHVTPGGQLMGMLLGGVLGLYHFFIQVPLAGVAMSMHPRVRRGEIADPVGPLFFSFTEHLVTLLGHIGYGAALGLTIASGASIGTLAGGIVAAIGLAALSTVNMKGHESHMGPSGQEEPPASVAFLREEEEQQEEALSR